MSYASGRRYTKAQAAVLVCEYVLKHKDDPDFSFTIQDVMRLTGRGYQQTYYLLIELDEVLRTYIERDQGRTRQGRWSRVLRRVLRLDT